MEKSSKPAGSSHVSRCGCKQPYQDARYGQGRRVHNQMADKAKIRCTACGTEKLYGG